MNGHEQVNTRDIADIVMAQGLVPGGIRFLARGAMTEVWDVDTEIGWLVVRLDAHVTGDGPRFVADAAVRARLLQYGAQVVAPIAQGVLVTAAGGERPWSVDRMARGERLSGVLPDHACGELGILLARLHTLPSERYGILQNRDDALVGSAVDPVSGLRTRLVDPWPYGSKSASEDVLDRVAPNLVHRMRPMEDEIRALVEGGPYAVSHTDLHAGQMQVTGSHLAALLDFGDAAILPRAWDIASFALFHGWDRLPILLDGYTSDDNQRRKVSREARLLAVPLALHHLNRSVREGQPGRTQPALRFLHRALVDGTAGSYSI